MQMVVLKSIRAMILPRWALIDMKFILVVCVSNRIKKNMMKRKENKK